MSCNSAMSALRCASSWSPAIAVILEWIGATSEAKVAPLFSERHGHDALILATPRSRHEACLLESPDERGERAGIQAHHLAE